MCLAAGWVPETPPLSVLGTSTEPGTAQLLKETELAAGALGVKLLYLDLQVMDIEPAFQAATKRRTEGVLVLGGPVINSRRTQIADLAAKNRLPAVYGQPEFMNAVASCLKAQALPTRTVALRLMSIRF